MGMGAVALIQATAQLRRPVVAGVGMLMLFALVTTRQRPANLRIAGVRVDMAGALRLAADKDGCRSVAALVVGVRLQLLQRADQRPVFIVAGGIMGMRDRPALHRAGQGTLRIGFGLAGDGQGRRRAEAQQKRQAENKRKIALAPLAGQEQLFNLFLQRLTHGWLSLLYRR